VKLVHAGQSAPQPLAFPILLVQPHCQGKIPDTEQKPPDPAKASTSSHFPSVKPVEPGIPGNHKEKEARGRFLAGHACGLAQGWGTQSPGIPHVRHVSRPCCPLLPHTPDLLTQQTHRTGSNTSPTAKHWLPCGKNIPGQPREEEAIP
jgi:hypothetical protein